VDLQITAAAGKVRAITGAQLEPGIALGCHSQ